jgi:hypothetical protein
MKKHPFRFGSKKLFARKPRSTKLAGRRFSLGGGEHLELRALLTAASGLQNPWQDTASALDVHSTVPTMRSMLASSSGASSAADQATTPSTTSTSSTPDSPLLATSFSTLDTSAADPGTAPVVSSPIVTPLDGTALAQFRLEAEDTTAAHNPITSITQGQDFTLAAFVSDIRSPAAQFPGVWAAFMNATYDSSLVSITSTAPNPAADPGNNGDPGIVWGSYFSTGLRSGDFSTPGQIVGIGSSSLKSSGSGLGDVLLFRMTVHTTAAGVVTFTPSFDSAQDHDSSFIDPPTTFTADDIQFTPTSLTIVSQPTVSITPSVSQNEGNTGTTPFVFTVSLSGTSTQPVTVAFATSPGTAQADDFVAQSGTLTFAPGDSSKLVTIGVVGDTTIETDETFSVTLSSPVGATLGATSSGVGTIVNDDTPSIGISGVSQLEGNESNNMVFTVTTSQPSATAVLVPFHTVDGTAVSTGGAADFDATSGTLTFAAGSGASQLVTVTILGDTTNEDNESFHLVLTQPANAVFDASNGDAVGTLLNDDGSHITFTQTSVSHNEGDSGTTPFVFTVNIGAASDIPVTVQYSTQDGPNPAHSATAGSDYTAVSGTLTFTPTGPLTQDVTVLVNGDVLNEADENFVLNLSGAVNATLTDTSATGTIVNDDPLPTLSFQSSTVSTAEGNAGTTPMVFTVNLSAASGQTVTVQFATNDGTATVAGNDYTAASSTLTFAPGDTQKLITVLVNGDTTNEADETLTLDLFNSTNAGNATSTLTKITATGTISNDDAVPTLTLTGDSHAEGNSVATSSQFLFVATLSAASGQTILVPFTTADGTATVADGDYQATSGILTFSPGSTVQRITVFDIGDTKAEPDETFQVNLTPSPSTVTLGNASATGTIVNDDLTPTVGIVAPGPKNEGNTGTTDFVFTVSLSNASSQSITVNFTTTDGTATVTNTDYVGQNGILTFDPGQTSKLITVAVNGDTRNEGDETFNVVLSAPSNATLSSSQASAQALILNDDAVPAISITDVTHAEGDSGTTPFVFQVTLSTASGQTVTVVFATSDGSATTQNNDYIATSGTLTFAPGVTTQNVTVQVVGDLFVEPNEVFNVNLTSPTNATLADVQGIGTIQNEPADNITFTPSQVSGFVFVDVDNGLDKDAGEKTLSGVNVTLTGTSSVSASAVNKQTTTAADGSYSFAALDPGTYKVTFTQPAGYMPGKALSGGPNATVSTDGTLGFNITIPSLGGVQATNNNLAVRGLLSTGISMRLFTASHYASTTSSVSVSPQASALATPQAAALALPAVTASPLSALSELASTNADTAQFTQSGSIVTVHGTSGDDQFEFTAGSTDVVTINGVTREFDRASVTKIVFDGNGGHDTANLTGSSGDDVADVSIGSGTLSGAGFSVSVSNVSAINVNGGGGHDTATLHDTALNDHLQAEGDGVSLSNDFDEVTSLLAIAQVQAISTTGTDTAQVGSIDFTLQQQGNWIAA